MTKREVIMTTSEKSGIPQVVIQQCIDPFLESIVEALSKGERITFKNFGSFYVKETKERNSKNPLTGEKIIVAAKKIIKFKATANLEKKE